MKLQFRSFEEQDAAELEAMMMALYREDPEGEPLTGEKIERTISEFRRRPHKGRILIFEAGREIAGYALLVFYWSNELGGDVITIDELYVKDEWRNQGIGTAFFKHLSSHCAAGAKELALEVTPSNRRALEFYRRLGFRRSANRHLVKRLTGSSPSDQREREG